MADQKPQVVYKGIATRRTISAEEFKAAGVDGQKAVEWTKAGGNTLDADALSPEALALLAKDKEFVVPKKTQTS